jgi:tetratricopeptide (TPR) repeat protein
MAILVIFKKSWSVAKHLDSLVKSGYFTDTTELIKYKAAVYNVLGICYLSLKRLDSAYHYFNLLHNYVKSTNFKEGYVLSTYGIGDVHRDLGRLDSAFYYYRLSIRYARETQWLSSIRGIEFDMAKLYKEKKEIDSAFYFAYRCLNEYRTVPDTAKLIEVAFFISDLHQIRKQDDSAYFYLSYYTTLKERSLKNENIRKTHNLLFNETLQQERLEQEKKGGTAGISVKNENLRSFRWRRFSVHFCSHSLQKQPATTKSK